MSAAQPLGPAITDYDALRRECDELRRLLSEARRDRNDAEALVKRLRLSARDDRETIERLRAALGTR